MSPSNASSVNSSPKASFAGVPAKPYGSPSFAYATYGLGDFQTPPPHHHPHTHQHPFTHPYQRHQRALSGGGQETSTSLSSPPYHQKASPFASSGFPVNNHYAHHAKPSALSPTYDQRMHVPQQAQDQYPFVIPNHINTGSNSSDRPIFSETALTFKPADHDIWRASDTQSNASSSPILGSTLTGMRSRAPSSPHDLRPFSADSGNISSSSIPPGLGLQFLAEEDSPVNGVTKSLNGYSFHENTGSDMSSPYVNPLTFGGSGVRQLSNDISHLWNGGSPAVVDTHGSIFTGRQRSQSSSFPGFRPGEQYDGTKGQFSNATLGSNAFGPISAAGFRGEVESNIAPMMNGWSRISGDSPSYLTPTQQRQDMPSFPARKSLEEDQPRFRSRSKSTSAALAPKFGAVMSQSPGFIAPPGAFLAHKLSNSLLESDISGLTVGTPDTYSPHIFSQASSPSSVHQRSSTQPRPEQGRESSGPHNERQSPIFYQSSSSRNAYYHELPTQQPRRLSMVDPMMTGSVDSSIGAEINDYFENKSRRASAWQEADKSAHKQKQEEGGSHPWPLCVVEFKAGRKDYFYIPRTKVMSMNVGDLVFVDADRGKDLGKLIHMHIMNREQLQAYQAAYPDVLMDTHGGGKEVELAPKQILSKATPAEVAMPLMAKSEDEAKAVEFCTEKIIQRQLPMQIVDAEFQWDRKKLTFYFISDRRIDFRELVRELFKTYKTRIWMCAVNPTAE